LAGAVLLLMVFAVAPALAASDNINSIDFKFSACGSTPCTPQEGQAISGVWNAVAEARSNVGGTPATIQSVTVEIHADTAGLPALDTSKSKYTRTYSLQDPSPPAATHTLGWDTNSVTPYNGVYHVDATVNDAIGGGQATATVGTIKVNNPPAAPSGLSVSAAVQGVPTLSVSWNASSDHQLTGYKLFRSTNAGTSYQEVTFTTSRSYQDSGLPFGSSIRYQLQAFRYSPVLPQPGIGGGTATSASVTIPAPPPPSPAAAGGTDVSKPGGPTPGFVAPGDKLGQTAKGRPISPVILQPPDAVSGPHRDGGSGFAPLLPFDKSAPQVDSIESGNGESPLSSVLNAPGRLVRDQIRVNPVRFFAAAALLLVTAVQLGLAARRLLKPTDTDTQSTNQLGITKPGPPPISLA